MSGGSIFALYHSNRFEYDEAVATDVKLDMIQFGVVIVIGFAIGAGFVSILSSS